jgi:mannitol/fructose-specific phosphotransferase system IIA component (Ntr-type)
MSVLAGVMSEETIDLSAAAGDWKAAITQVGQLLVRAGAIEERYIAAMIRAVEAKGPYIVVAKGVAMPHASADDGASRVALSMVRLAQPVSFGHGSNDPVDLLFCLCSPDFMSHISVLVGLTSLLENPAKLAEIRAAGDKATVLKVVESAF